MNFLPHFNFWDIILILAVSIQATVIAYVYQPKWKAFILNLPIPFTFATLAVGSDINITNVMGLLFLLIFTHLVRMLYYNLKLNIILSIIISAAFYCLIGSLLAPILPKTTYTFWTTVFVITVLSAILFYITPYRAEQGHRSPLPIWIKLPLVVMVITILIIIKTNLQGFTTVFPMVGVITAYEARHSLWTICRQIPIIVLTILPMMVACRLTQSAIGLKTALAFSWLAFAAVFVLLTYSMWRNDKVAVYNLERL